jgi:methionyl-tRNA synthetase
VRVLITSALPYANGPLHFGHIAGAYLPGDVYARYMRSQGHQVLYLCGSDEYGVAITLSAELAGRTPREQVDLFHGINRALFEKLNFSFDFYGRTTSKTHSELTVQFYEALRKGGHIEERTEEHLFSEKENRFLADRYVLGTCPKCGHKEARGDECPKCGASYEAIDLLEPRSKITSSPLVRRKSLHLYLRFDHFKEELKTWLLQKKWKENVLKFAMSYVDELKPRAITRDSDWGVPVPGYPGKVFYVWFDAPIGYLSIAKEWAHAKGEAWEPFWLDGATQLVQFIGKDNIPFHAVFFPAMLMGQEHPFKLPDEIPANEFYLLEGRQFSKSDNWAIDLESFFASYSVDQIRYSIAASAPESSDSEFTWKGFQMHCNSELLGKFGNFVHRVLSFCQVHAAGKVPPIGTLTEIDKQFIEQMNRLVDEISFAYETFSLRLATKRLMELAHLGNSYFDAAKPWVVAKDQARSSELATILNLSIQCIKQLALASSPLIPATAEAIWQLIGYSSSLTKASWRIVQTTPVPSEQRLPSPQPLFRKIEDEEIEKEVASLGVKRAKGKDPITIDDWKKVDLRVGQILEASVVPKSSKLLKLLIDLGSEKRVICSGIAQSFSPAELVGKKVMVVANLAPAKLMGIESQGMVLLAGPDKEPLFPDLASAPLGSSIH